MKLNIKDHKLLFDNFEDLELKLLRSVDNFIS
jgi:hypothetical protein